MHARGVQIFSITDHDTLGAYGRFEVPRGMRVVSGIEINTTYKGSEVHLLGYRVPTQISPLTGILERNRAARRIRVGRIVEQLRAAGHEIQMRHVEAEAIPRASLGRPHVGKAMIRLGIVPDIESAFREYLRPGRPGYVASTHMTPHEAIDAILASGGVAVLAHPGRLSDYAIIDELVERGLQGLEVFYPAHDRALTAHFRDVAKRHKLVITGGADFHDARYNTRGVGVEIDQADIQPFLGLVS